MTERPKLLFLVIEIPPNRFYISVSYLGVAYHCLPAFFSEKLTEKDDRDKDDCNRNPLGGVGKWRLCMLLTGIMETAILGL